MELSTERSGGWSAGSIPISKVWDYLERYGLPDWWEPIILQADSALVASFSEDKKSGTAA